MYSDQDKNVINIRQYNVLYQKVSDMDNILNDIYNREKEKELREEEMRERYFDEEY